MTKQGPLVCDGKVALVTGTSRGLGKAIAQRLAREGATVALTARTMEPDPKYQGSLRQTLTEIEAAGGAGVAIQADLSSAQDRERLFAEVVERVGAPDMFPSEHLLRLREAAEAKFADKLAGIPRI